MDQQSLTGCDAPDVVRLPPDHELRTALTQALQEIDKRRIAGPQVMGRTTLGDDAFRLVGPGRSWTCSGVNLGA